VVFHRDPSQPNPGHDEADVVRSVRPLGVKDAGIILSSLTKEEIIRNMAGNQVSSGCH